MARYQDTGLGEKLNLEEVEHEKMAATRRETGIGRKLRLGVLKNCILLDFEISGNCYHF